MKFQPLIRSVLLAGIMAALAPPVLAQVRPGTIPGQGNSGNQLFNPYRVAFQEGWQFALTDRAKLIDVAEFGKDRHPCLVMLVESADRTDPRRTLRVTHWDNIRFSSDYSIDFIGRPTDTLLAGHFRVLAPVPAAVTAAAPTKPNSAASGTGPDKKKSKPKTPSVSVLQHVVTTEGIYEGNGSAFTRILNAPANVKLALDFDKANDLLVVGSGDDAYMVEVGAADVHPLAQNPPVEGPGFVRTGTGTQEFTDSSAMDIGIGVRFVQSYWSGRYHWYIGLARGTADPTRTNPNATTGDKLVVYTPVFGSRDKSFWALRHNDFEESWRSDMLPGHVLDIRVGDPKGEGKPGILVLTSENKDTERHLHFFTPITLGNGLFNGR